MTIASNPRALMAALEIAATQANIACAVFTVMRDNGASTKAKDGVGALVRRLKDD